MKSTAKDLERAKIYRHKNREKIRLSQASYHERNREEITARHICRKRNITLDQYRKMFEDQLNRCAICDSYETRLNAKKTGIMKLCVDHDPVTGKVRALLCYNCNLGIGFLKDSPEVITKARDYIIQHRDILHGHDDPEWNPSSG